jgi:hypothetical protein
MFKWLMKIGFFTSIFTLIDTRLLSSPTIWFHYLIIVPLLACLISYYKLIPKYLLVISSIFFIIGIYQSLNGNNTIGLFIKVFSSLFFLVLFFYFYIRYHSFDVDKLFQFYINCTIFTASFFFFQLLCFKLGISFVYDLSYINLRYLVDKDVGFIPLAFLTEPAHLALVLCPAAFIGVHNLLMRKKVFMGYVSSALVVGAVIFCGSSTGYLGLLLSFIFIAISYRAFSVLLGASVFSVVGFLLIYTYNPKFTTRVDDSMEIFLGTNLTEATMKNLNASTMILYNHFIIASSNFKDHPFAGTGLGSHPVAFYKYTPFDNDYWWFEMNKEDACSLLFRMMSETGVVGLALLLFFLARFSTSKKRSINNTNWLISKSVIVLMIPALVRNGSYLLAGVPFFLLLYYYTFKDNRARVEQAVT